MTAKKTAPNHDDILTDAVHSVIRSVRVARRTVAPAELSLRLQLAAEEYARAEVGS